MEGKGSGKNTPGRVLDPAWNEVCEIIDHNPESEYSTKTLSYFSPVKLLPNVSAASKLPSSVAYA